MILVSTFLICALIIALGVVLGLKIYKDEPATNGKECGTSQSQGQGQGESTTSATSAITTKTSATTTSTTQTTTKSPIFVSDSPEGHYKYAAVSSDAGPCSTVGT